MDITHHHSSTSTPRTGETAWLWMLKILTGPLLVVLLIVHLVVNHLVAETGLLTWSDVIRYFQTPGIVVMEIVFLGTVVLHSLLGVRGIVLDLNPNRKVLKVADWMFSIIGVGFVIYGIWLALTIAALGK